MNVGDRVLVTEQTSPYRGRVGTIVELSCFKAKKGKWWIVHFRDDAKRLFSEDDLQIKKHE